MHQLQPHTQRHLGRAQPGGGLAGHAVEGHLHRPGDEKRSVVVFEPEQFNLWLMATPLTAIDMCLRPDESVLVSEQAPRGATVQANLSLL